MSRKLTWTLVGIGMMTFIGCGGSSLDKSGALDVHFTLLQTEGEHFIQGTVFNDINGDGFMGTCEPGIAGVTLDLKTIQDDIMSSVTTNAQGYYAFAVTVTGDYKVVETDASGYVSNVNSVELMEVDTDVTVNFADQTMVPSYAICGKVYEDMDGDGVMNMSESGIEGVMVSLSDAGDTLTNALGIYAFAVTVTGPYEVSVTEPEGYMSTTPNPENIEVIDDHIDVHFGLRRYLDVPVDVKPGSDINPVNLRSKGVLPVAIPGNEEFDVTLINPETILLNGVAPLRWNVEDVCGDNNEMDTPDGYGDLTLKFDTQEIASTLGEPERGDIITLYMSGEMYDMTAIIGAANIYIVQVPK